MIPFRTIVIVTALSLGASLCQAQSPEFVEQGNVLKYASTPVQKIAVASANMKVGVSLERLTLISGEGNTDKKVMSGLLAGAVTMLSMRGGGGVGAGGIDFAEREPINEHLNGEEATRINTEALEILVDRLKETGLEVAPPQAVAAAPFYATVKGEAGLTTDKASQDGGLFKKSYYYGFYRTPVAGLKYRETGMFTLAFADEDFYPKAREAADAGSALDVNLAFYNDKKVFGLFDFTVRLWAPVQGRKGDVPALTVVLKNKDDFTVPSGGKDAYAYWLAFKPTFTTLATALATQVHKAMPPK